jgi:hypothetical protein
MSKHLLRGATVAIAGGLLAAQPAAAITVVATQDTTTLVNALLAGANTGIIVTSTSLSGQRDDFDIGLPDAPGGDIGVISSGTYTNASGTYGIGRGIVLSTGGVAPVVVDGTTFVPGYGDGDNSGLQETSWGYGGTFPPPVNPADAQRPATAAQELLLDPITRSATEEYNHFDVTELVINFDMQPGVTEVVFEVVFGSEEFPNFIDSEFVDGFGMFLNGQNIAFSGGLPINIRHPDVQNINGTELNGLLAPGGIPVLTFRGGVNPTGNELRFIVADTSDAILDTTVYFSALAGVPLPGTVWLGLTAFGALFGRRALAARRARGQAVV